MLGTRHCAHNKRGVNSCPPSVKRPTEALGLVGHQGASVRGNAKVSVLMELLPPLEKGSDPTPGHDSFTWTLGLAGAMQWQKRRWHAAGDGMGASSAGASRGGRDGRKCLSGL